MSRGGKILEEASLWFLFTPWCGCTADLRRTAKFTRPWHKTWEHQGKSWAELSWAEQELWHGPSEMEEVPPGRSHPKWEVGAVAAGRSAEVSGQCAMPHTYCFHSKQDSNKAYLPQIGLQLPFQMCGGHYTCGRKKPVFYTFILINGKTSIA